MTQSIFGPRWLRCVSCFASLLLFVGCGEPSSSSPTEDQTPTVSASKPDTKPVEKEADPDPPAAEPAMRVSDDAFRMAAYDGRLDTVRSAIESGTDVNVADPAQSLTALHMAAYNGHTETVTYLIEQGATVDCRDGEGKTPLIHASTGPYPKTVVALIEAGADVNAKVLGDDATLTPLMMAAGLGEAEVVKVLLAHDADKAMTDEDNETALDHAKNGGHTAIVEMLE